MDKMYSCLWLVLVDIRAKCGLIFKDLIECENSLQAYQDSIGAWANILFKANTIQEAIGIVPLGLDELGFEVIKFDKIENLESLVDDSLIEESVIEEAEWLFNSNFVFKISGKLHGYRDKE